MKLFSLTLENFGSFRKKQVFRFPVEPGLYFMQGLNLAEPTLGENGTGKSTLWKALCWCLFDKTGEGMRAGDVSSWDVGKNTSVSVELELGDGSAAVMHRNWSPNKWTLDFLHEPTIDLTKDTANPVLQELGLEFLPFLNCILTAQGEPMFLDLKADAQASLFGSVLGLDRWLDLSSKASKLASTADAQLRAAERVLSEAQGALSNPKDYTELIEKFESKRSAQILDCTATYEQTLFRHRGLKEKLTKALAKNSAYVRDWEARHPALLLELKENERDSLELDAVSRALGQQEGALRADTELTSFLQTHNHCPTCDSDLDDKRKGSKVKHLLVKIEQESKTLQESTRAWSLGRKKSQAQLLHLETELRKGVTEAQELHRAVQDVERELLVCSRALDSIESEVDRVEGEACPYVQLQTEERKKAQKQREQVACANEEVKRLQERYSLFSFWVRGFKEIRLQQVSTALVELEIEVNSCVAALGLVNWEIRFDVDRETKGGSIKRGFNVGILSPHNTKPVPWAAWSGGEKQRLRLAGTMGLANLIRSRTGCSLPLEVWDEPATALGGQGVQDLLEALASRASAEQRVIWLIDHTAHSFGSFAGGALVTKTKEGSFLEQK